MNAFQKKITGRVVSIHVVIIFLVAIIPFMRGCFTPKPKEIITFIDFGAPAPQVNIEQVSQLSDPEPPAPEPPPERIPEPVKKKPVPTKKKPEPIKKKPEPVKKTEPKKPKWKPTKVDPTKSKVIKATPKTPTFSAADIQKELSGITSSTPTKTTGSPSQHSSYDSHIYTVFYNAWSQPGSPAIRPAEVTISIQSNGRITKRKLTRSSGDTEFDKTVMAAVNRISIFPQSPPAGYPLDNIIVQFRIID